MKRIAIVWSLAAAAACATADPPAPEELQRTVAAWEARRTVPVGEDAAADRPALPAGPLSKAEAETWRTALLDAWRAHLKAQARRPQGRLPFPRWTSVEGVVKSVCFFEHRVSPTEAKTAGMRYGAVTRGERPASGWPVFLNLHAGGTNRASNDRSWAAAMLQHKVKGALTVCPRSPVDTAESWYHPASQAALEQLLVDVALRWEIDQDRVYLYGYSMGGWGVFHLGPTLADRWAAVAASAGAGFVGATGRAAPDNLRNTPMMIQIGTEDRAYGRYPRSRAFAAALEALHAADPEGYVVAYKEHRGKGHQIRDGNAPKWLLRHVRDPRPTRVVLQHPVSPPGVGVDDLPRLLADGYGRRLSYPRRRFWLRLEDPGPYRRVVARRDGNDIVIEEARHVKSLTVLLDDRLVDLDRPVRVLAGDRELFAGKVERSPATLLETLLEHRDPGLVFCAAVTVEPPDAADAIEAGEPADADGFLRRAQVRWARKRFAEAAADVEAALELAPERGAAELLPRLAQLAAARDDAAAVAEVYRRRGAAAGDDPRALAGIVIAALRVGESCRPAAVALELAERAVAAGGGEDPQVLRALAAAQQAKGRTAEAVATLDRALALPATGKSRLLQAILTRMRQAYAAAEPAEADAP